MPYLESIKQKLAELESAANSFPTKGGDTIHDIRVMTKKLRALWRFADQLQLTPRDISHSQIVILRDISRSLSGVREVSVAATTLEILSSHADAELKPLRKMRKHFKRHSKLLYCTLTPKIQKGTFQLRDSYEQLETVLRNPDLTINTNTSPLDDFFHHVIHASDAVIEMPDRDHLHELRKRIKDYIYICEFLGSKLSASYRNCLNDCKTLSEQIGEFLDIDNLKATVLREFPSLISLLDNTISDLAEISDTARHACCRSLKSFLELHSN